MSEPCPKSEDLSAWLDGEMSTGERARMDAHLAGCDACRVLLVDWRALRAEFRGLPDERLGFDLSQVIRGRLAARPIPPSVPRARRWRSLIPTGIGAAASLSLGLMMGWSLTAPLAGVAPTAAALEVFAPVAPGGLCTGLDSCFRSGASGRTRP